MARQLSNITQKENIHRRAHWIDKFLQNQEEKNLQKLEKTKKNLRAQVRNLIKKSMGQTYETIKDLEQPTSSQYDESYKRLWRSILDDSKIMNTIATSSPYTDESLRHNIIGYTMFIEKQVQLIQNDKRFRLRTIIGATRRIIDTYFPEHYSEQEAWLEHQQEDAERNRQQQEEEYAEWYEEQRDSGIFD